jgi:hypothetical protein
VDNEELRQAAAERQDLLNSRLEMLIKALYAAKELNPHLQIWFVVNALEIYRMQSTAQFKMVYSGAMEPDLISDISQSLTDQLSTILEMAAPLLRVQPD